MRKATQLSLIIISALCLLNTWFQDSISFKGAIAHGLVEFIEHVNNPFAANAIYNNALLTVVSDVSNDTTTGNAVKSALPISYRLVRGSHRYNRSETHMFDCTPGPTVRFTNETRVGLAASQHPFEFHTIFKTSLNILVMGDSVAVQFGSWLQTAGGATNKTVLATLNWRKWGLADGLAVAPVEGGGSVAYWRILGFWEKATLGKPLPNHGRGWRESWVQILQEKLPNQGDKYNVLIFRVSHPWLSPDEVDETRLNETIEVAKTYLGQDLIVIFQTAAFNNNVVTGQDLRNFRAMNGIVRSFVTKLNSSDVLLSDVEAYMDNVIEWNAKHLGMDVGNSSTYILERVALVRGNKFPHHIAQVCSERVPPGSFRCKHNMLSNDGMHFCMESLGSRMFANTACLIQCAYDTSQIVRQCERGCNEKFFRLIDAIPGIEFIQ